MRLTCSIAVEPINIEPSSEGRWEMGIMPCVYRYLFPTGNYCVVLYPAGNQYSLLLIFIPLKGKMGEGVDVHCLLRFIPLREIFVENNIPSGFNINSPRDYFV